MSIHIISIALLVSLAVALLLALKVGLPGDRQVIAKPSPTVVTSAHSEQIVVMPTSGGRLEVATVRAREAFARSDSRVLLDFLDLGTTASEVRVDATYRFHIEMKTHWPLRIVGKTCLVRAGAIEPTLPVAFDSGTVERRTSSGWARFNRAENLQALEASLTQQLAERAPLYRSRAQEAGRQVVAEFVTTWLLKEHDWQRDPDHRVIVLFDEQPEPRGVRAILFGGPSAGPPDENDKSLWRH